MNQQFIQKVFEKYIAEFRTVNDTHHAEWFKWRAVEQFQKHWDIDAEDFPEMFKLATKSVSVLMEGMSCHPIGTLKKMMKEHPEEIEFIREQFRGLYSEDGGDLVKRQQRVEVFITQINSHVAKYYQNVSMYGQTNRSAVDYLALWRPAENYFFKSNQAHYWVQYAEFGLDIGYGAGFSLPNYYKMCDEVLAEVKRNQAILDIHPTRFTKALPEFEDDYHILVYDLLYCAHVYSYYKGMPKPIPKEKRLAQEKARQRKAELEESLTELLDEQAQWEPMTNLPSVLGRRVRHKTFGEGEVGSEVKNIIGVQFADCKKSFVYHDAFAREFLSIAEPELVERFQQYPIAVKQINRIRSEIREVKGK